jgi:hypothetical protein
MHDPTAIDDSQASLPDAPEPGHRFSGKQIVIPGVILMVAISIAAFTARMIIGGDKQNAAVRDCFDLVVDYVNHSKGEWPRSWADLEKMPKQGKWYEENIFKVAKDIVEIDFQADPNVIARQKPEDFTAIRAKKPIYDYKTDPRISTLIETLRHYHPPPPTPASNSEVKPAGQS